MEKVAGLMWLTLRTIPKLLSLLVIKQLETNHGKGLSSVEDKEMKILGSISPKTNTEVGSYSHFKLRGEKKERKKKRGQTSSH